MIRLRAAFLIAMLIASSSACGSDPGTAEDNEALGEVNLQLAVGPLKLNSARYKITGPRGSIKSGTIKLKDSTQLSAVVGGLKAAVGYTVELSAVASNDTTTCSGSARFDVLAGQTSSVAVHLTCLEAPQRGSVSVNGTINVCPVVASVSASPAQALVGETSALSVVSSDADHGPDPLSYQWTTSAGAFDDSTAARPTFTCVAPGLSTIIVSVSDGDPAASCLGYGSVTVNCTAPSAN